LTSTIIVSSQEHLHGYLDASVLDSKGSKIERGGGGSRQRFLEILASFDMLSIYTRYA